ncbi:MAG TPA: nucleotide-binding protein [Bacteroidia bacterium]|jgi:predicted nucleotide-binding protein|nr:nucleotide-binding protein [Bacteroidia bacterium]
MEEEITIFISHGRSHLWNNVARYIENKLGINTVILHERPNKGRTVIEKLEEETEDCDFAIIVMTAEDTQADGSLRTRENVVHEIGFCQGSFGRENVLVLKQKGIAPFTNLSGIVYEEFEGENIKSTFPKIQQEIEELLEDLEEEEDD